MRVHVGRLQPQLLKSAMRPVARGVHRKTDGIAVDNNDDLRTVAQRGN